MVSKFPPEKIVIRPPVEAYSVLIPVTGGCSWNKCKFCGTYDGVYGAIQEYAIRPIEDVKKDIDYYAKKNYHGYPVFLLVWRFYPYKILNICLYKISFSSNGANWIRTSNRLLAKQILSR